MDDVDGRRAALAEALTATAAGSTAEHVVVCLPSHSMPQRLLEHHASQLPGLEHRALLDGLVTARSPGARVVVVVSEAPPTGVLDYYARLARPDDPDDARRRVSLLVVPDGGARGIAAKLLDRPDLLDVLRRRLAGVPAVIEPWNVTADEVAVAHAVGTPLNGGPPDLWPLGFKSASRRLFREAGVPLPVGVEDVHDPAEVAAAVTAIRHARPVLDRVVVKLDNSGAAEGNWVMPIRDTVGRPMEEDELARHLETHAPAWFVRDLALGGVVEELVSGRRVTSPSAQVQIRPGGAVVVRSTHEQVLGGEDGQAFVGSRFPADAVYAAEIADHALAVARHLAERGAVGWLSVDFVARLDDGDRALTAVDLNLRKGGTTHSYAALAHLAPGTYRAADASWVTDDGGRRHYRSGDALLVGPSHTVDTVVEAVAAAGLAFDHERREGVVLHTFALTRGRGTVGVTAIGRSAEEAERLFGAVPAAVAHRRTGRGDATGAP